jgi:glycosyltransferase involved in cell wall biosynthesis
MLTTDKTVISFVFNDFKNDIRVLKENVTISKIGLKTIVVATSSSKKMPKNEIKKSIKVERVRLTGFGIMPFDLIVYWIICIFKYRKYNIFHCNDLYTLPVGVVIKRLFNKKTKIIYDCHEHETEAHIYKNKKILKYIAKIIERSLIKYADQVITVSQSIAKDYAKRYGIKEPLLVLNCPYYNKYKKKNLFREKFKIPSQTKILLYQGEYRSGRGLEIIINGFNNLPDHIDMAFVMLGYGEYGEKIKKIISNKKKIFIHPPVSTQIYMDYVCSADIGVHLMENTCLNHDYALPNKVFEYAMAGLPVVVSNLKEIKQVVEDNGIGFVLNENTTGSFLAMLEKINKINLECFVDKLKSFSSKYNWEEQEKVMSKIYQSIMTGR